MKKRIKFIVVLFLGVSLMPLNVAAAGEAPDIVFMSEEEVAYYTEKFFAQEAVPYSDFSNTELGIFESDGKLMVLYRTNAPGNTSEIGIKQLMVQEKGGLLWKVVVTVDKLSKEDSNTFMGGFYFTSPVSGCTYKASGIHFAIVDGKEITKYASTAGFVFP